jgi:hypothetical protein
MTFNARRQPSAPDTAALGRSEAGRGEAFTRPQTSIERVAGFSVKIALSRILGIFRQKKTL